MRLPWPRPDADGELRELVDEAVDAVVRDGEGDVAALGKGYSKRV